MRTRTVVFSLIFHAAIAATLLGAAGKKIGRKATQVVLAEEKKKAKPAPPKPPPPPPPRAAPKPVEHKVASVTKTVEPLAKAAAPVAVATALTMTNDDGPGGIALAPAPKAAAAAAPAAKVASAVTEARKQRLREAANAPGEEGTCTEDPSKPVLIAQTPDIELTASARAEGIEGRLIMSLTIGPDGTVTAVRVVKSLSADMDAAAEAAVRQWRFKPAMACGKPVEGKFNLGRTFELGD